MRHANPIGSASDSPGGHVHIRRVVDLSLAIDPSTQVYPGDPEVRFRPAATIERDGFNLLELELGSQSGTNCDAPLHFLADASPIDTVPLELFIGPAVLIDVRGKAPREAITAADAAPYLRAAAPGTIAVFHTGWPQHYRTAAYIDHPILTPEACQA